MAEHVLERLIARGTTEYDEMARIIAAAKSMEDGFVHTLREYSGQKFERLQQRLKTFLVEVCGAQPAAETTRASQPSLDSGPAYVGPGFHNTRPNEKCTY